MSIWQDVEIELLIQLYKENKSRVDGMVNKKELYLEFQIKLQELGYIRTPIQINKKINNLKADYRKYKPGSTGSSPSGWKWYQKMHEILQERHFYNESQASTYDSMDVSLQEQNNDSDIWDDYENSDTTSTPSPSPSTSGSGHSSGKKKRKIDELCDKQSQLLSIMDEMKNEVIKTQRHQRENGDILRDEIHSIGNSIKEMLDLMKNNM